MITAMIITRTMTPSTLPRKGNRIVGQNSPRPRLYAKPR
ncbi:hypothetical protein BURCENBC7_AP1216 [Burkholderia cenocepacia BC7]|nr:hypothetical protein BURCENBC7_AP1216 [Burkholderia cenocepacia BC7]